MLRSGAPPAGFESDASGQGWWDNTLYRPGNLMGMGSPQGVAMDSQGWAVYVVDRARLYRYLDDVPQWTVLGNLPTAAIDEGISGLALDSLDSLLYINTNRGKFYKIKVPTPPPPGPIPTLAPRKLP